MELEAVVAEADIEAEAYLKDLRPLKDSPVTSEMNPRPRCRMIQSWFLESNLEIFVNYIS